MKKITTLFILLASLFLSSCNNTQTSEDHKHVYDVEFVSEKTKKTEATCLEPATYYYSCSCGKLGTSIFTSGEVNPNNHTGASTRTITSSTHKKSYTCCNLEVVKEAEHTGGSPKCGEKAHCIVCDFEYGNKGGHNYNKKIATSKYLVSKATCTSSATYYYSCSCGEASSNTFSYGEKDLNNHTGKEEWVITSSTHKKAYTCCNKITLEEESHKASSTSEETTCSVCGTAFKNSTSEEHTHTFDQEIVEAKYLVSKANCISSAIYYKSCTCGEKGTSTFNSGEKDSSNHTGSITYTSEDESNHKGVYSCCGSSISEAHSLNEKNICSKCSYEKITIMSENEWNEYVASLKTLNKLKNVDATLTSYTKKTNTNKNTEEEESQNAKVIIDDDSSLVYMTLKNVDENGLNTSLDGYLKFVDKDCYQYLNTNDTYYKKTKSENLSNKDRVSIYQESLELSYIIDETYSNLTFDVNTNTYSKETTNNNITYLYKYCFKNGELFSIYYKKTKSYEETNEEEIYYHEYDFLSETKLSLPSFENKGTEISENDYNTFISSLTIDSLLKNYKCEKVANVNYISSTSNMYKSSKQIFIGDASNNLAYKYNKNYENTVTTNNKEEITSQSEENSEYEYYYFFSNNTSYKTSKDYSLTNPTWTALEKTGSSGDDLMQKEFIGESDESELKFLSQIKHSYLIYNEIYGAYNLNSSDSTDEFTQYLYYFNDNKLVKCIANICYVTNNMEIRMDGTTLYSYDINESLSLPSDVDQSILNS